MAQFIVRNLEDDVKARLDRRAERHGHTLRNASKDQSPQASRLGTRIAARFAKVGLTTDLPELHG